MLSEEFTRWSESSVLCWLATADENGVPNVSPKEVWAVFDPDHLVIANIASPISARNVNVNPEVCVCFIDIFAQKGVKVMGIAENVLKSNPSFPYWSEKLLAMAGERFPMGSTFVVTIKAVTPLLAPSYRLYPNETTEESQRAAALKTYGVKE